MRRTREVKEEGEKGEKERRRRRRTCISTITATWQLSFLPSLVLKSQDVFRMPSHLDHGHRGGRERERERDISIASSHHQATVT